MRWMMPESPTAGDVPTATKCGNSGLVVTSAPRRSWLVATSTSQTKTERRSCSVPHPSNSDRSPKTSLAAKDSQHQRSAGNRIYARGASRDSGGRQEFLICIGKWHGSTRILSTAGTVTVGSLATATGFAADDSANRDSSPSTDLAGQNKTTGSWFDPSRTWHFFDLWHFDHIDQLRLGQGRAEFQADATYVDPPIGSLASWPTVYRDEATGMWRMLYSADWKPYQLMMAESDDGRHWRPLPQPDVIPDAGKVAPHHLFTLEGGSGGAVYLDPIAADGFPFKVFVHCQGNPAYERAVADPKHRWHKTARRVGSQRFINDEFTLVSRDGVHWQPRHDLSWSLPDWHPEPPIFAFYNRFTRRHAMTVRPGWGDRRQCLQTTANFQQWSGPELLAQPDFLDRELIEFYGMPVFPYGDGYVGLLWIFHCQSDEPTRGFNRFTGPLDCQLAFSHDGIRFSRVAREPFIEVCQGTPPSAARSSRRVWSKPMTRFASIRRHPKCITDAAAKRGVRA